MIQQNRNALSSWHLHHLTSLHNIIEFDFTITLPTHVHYIYIYIHHHVLLITLPFLFSLSIQKYIEMASSLASSSTVLWILFLTIATLHLSSARKLSGSDPQLQFQYHRGPLLKGKISVNLIWYGKFKPSQKAIVADFITSLSSPKPVTAQPSVATWRKATDKYYKNSTNSNRRLLLLVPTLLMELLAIEK